MRYVIAAALLVLVVQSRAFSQTAIGPFSGTHSETFDEFPPQDVDLFLPNPTPTFGGFGTITMTGPFPALAVYNGGTHPFGNYVPHDGDQFAVTQHDEDTMQIDFASGVQDFGGYWGQDVLHVVFLDSSAATVGSGDYTPASNVDGTLQWLGWHVDSPFTSVVITPTNGPALLVMDSLQVVNTPEPASAGMIALAGMAVSARRRRR